VEEVFEPVECFCEAHRFAVVQNVDGLALGTTEHGAEHEMGWWAGVGFEELGPLASGLKTGWRTHIAGIFLNLDPAFDVNTSEGDFVLKVIERVAIDMIKL
jgi:hypothetical protein